MSKCDYINKTFVGGGASSNEAPLTQNHLHTRIQEERSLFLQKLTQYIFFHEPSALLMCPKYTAMLFVCTWLKFTSSRFSFCICSMFVFALLCCATHYFFRMCQIFVLLCFICHFSHLHSQMLLISNCDIFTAIALWYWAVINFDLTWLNYLGCSPSSY